MGKKYLLVDVGDLSTEAAIEYIEGIKKRNIGKESLTMKHDISEPGKGGLSVRSEYNFEKALKIFKKKVMNDGILKDLKKYQFYEKPTSKRRRRKAEAIRRRLKAQSIQRRFQN